MSNQHDLRCPRCQSQDGVTIQIPIWVLLTHDGTDADTPQDHEWDDNSPAICAECRFGGIVADFTRPSSALTEYVAYFRTTAGPGNDIYQAQTPDQVLRIAQEIFDRDDESLGFTPGDCPELQEIRITTEDAEEVLTWQTDEYRLQLAAPKLLKALENQIETTREIVDAWNNTDKVHGAVQDLINDLEYKSQSAQAVVEAYENSDLSGAIEELEQSLDENLALIADAKGGRA
jgi:hypothetical protein